MHSLIFVRRDIECCELFSVVARHVFEYQTESRSKKNIQVAVLKLMIEHLTNYNQIEQKKNSVNMHLQGTL